MHECLHDSELLPIASRQFPDRPIQHDAEPFNQRVTPGRVDRPTEPGERVELRLARQSIEETQISGHIPNVTPRLDTLGAAITPQDPRSAAGRADEIKQKPDRRALARAVRTEEREDLALLDPQVEPGQSADSTAVRFRERRDLDCRCGRH